MMIPMNLKGEKPPTIQRAEANNLKIETPAYARRGFSIQITVSLATWYSKGRVNLTLII